MPLKGEHPTRPTYEIKGPLPGGRSQVVVANHKIFGRLCVQKVVDVGMLSGHTAFQEPRLLDKIAHPRITPIDEVQWDPERDNAITFVMPLYEGGSVANALQEGHRFSLHEIIAIGCDVADALAHVHGHVGFIDRDVKPGNVFMDAARDRGYLGDFGSAAEIDAGDGTAPSITTTLPYMPPEAVATGRISALGDVYGLGFVLFEMLYGSIRWELHSELKMQMRLMQGRRSLPDSALNSFPPHVPESFRRVVRKAMRATPDQRFHTAADLLNGLRDLQVIDWRHVSGEDLDGEWIGSWPPHKPRTARHTYRVTSRILGSGKARGQRRLEAAYRRPDSPKWRAAGVPPKTVGATDKEGLAQFFTQVSARAAHRIPAR